MDKDRIRRNLQKLKDGNASQEQMQAYLNSEASAFQAPKPKVQHPPATTAFTEGKPQDDPKSWQRRVSSTARPLLEAGGMVAGATAGAAEGTLLAPIVGTAGGGVAGGAMGYAAGTNIADQLDVYLGIIEPLTAKEATKKAVKDVGTGAMYEMGGRAVVAAPGQAVEGGKALLSKFPKVGEFFQKIKGMFPSLSDQGILLKAKEILQKARTATTESEAYFATTEKETGELLTRTGIKEVPTHAQMTGKPSAGVFEQSAAAKDKELMEILKVKDANILKEAGENISKKFPGEAGVDDVVGAVGKREAQLAKTSEALSAQSDEALTAAKVGTEPEHITGEGIYGAAKSAKKEAKKGVDELYAKIPEGTLVEANPIQKALSETQADLRKLGGGSSTNPSHIIKQIKRVLSPQKTSTKHITFARLQDWRSQLSQEIREATAGVNPNLKLARRLKILKGGIDDTLDQMAKFGGGQEQIAKDYLEATRAFIKYDKTFRKGAVGDILRPGAQTTGLNTLHSDMPAKFFQPKKVELADSLIDAVGINKARDLIQPYANVNFLSKATNGGILNQKVAREWLGANKTLLKKYNLYDDFLNIVNKGAVADEAVVGLQQYQKTVASTILDADVDKVIKQIFIGKGKVQSAKTATDLLNLPGVKDNPAAINGIKNSFKDFMLKEMELSGVDVLGNPLMSLNKAKGLIQTYEPAMKVLYKDSPKQLQALKDYHKVLEMLTRNKNISYPGGSTTTEKLAGTRKEVFGTIGRNVTQLIAVARGKGWFFSTLKNLWTSLTGAPGKFSNAQINALLSEAIYNPEVAQTIMMASKRVPLKIIDQRIKYHLAGAGAYTAKKGADTIIDLVD